MPSYSLAKETVFRIQKGINLFNPKKILFFLWLFLLVLPKGGFKIANIPLTWGYLLLGITSFFVLLEKSWTIQTPRFQALLCLLPFQIISACTIAINGAENIGMTISFIICFFFLPFAFLFLFSNAIENLDLSFFIPLFKKGILFIASYGIFLFFFKQISGHFIEIPFLTTNFGDFGQLEEKHINRGIVFKLISTYNNGNIYGICLLMLLPLYCFWEKSGWKRLPLKFSLLLTLSRTVWIGLLFHEIFFAIFVDKNYRKGVATMLSGIIFSVISLLIISQYYGFSFSFFFDSELGGRSGQLSSLKESGYFSSLPFWGISEIVYAGILYSFGFLGLITFIIAMLGPVVLGILNSKPSPFRNSLYAGAINYLFISISDGAILYLPTMVFFWFLISLAARKETLRERHLSSSSNF